MRMLPVIVLGFLTLGCGHLTHTATLPSPTEPAPKLLERVMDLPLANVFPKVLEILLEQGYHLEAADRSLGLVRFSRVWTNTHNLAQPQSHLQCTLLFSPAGAEKTRVRLLATGHLSWWGKNGQTDGEHAPVPHAQADQLLTHLATHLDQANPGLKAQGLTGRDALTK